MYNMSSLHKYDYNVLIKTKNLFTKVEGTSLIKRSSR